MTDPTIIRAATLVQGNLTGEDPVEVEGQIIGQITLTNTLTVQPGGLVRGQIHVHQAIILGRVEGAITASERVYLGPKAVVVADLECPVIRVDDGAVLHGKLVMELEGELPAVAPLALPANQGTPAKAPAQATKPAWGAAQPASFTSNPKPADKPAPVAQPVSAPSFTSTRPAAPAQHAATGGSSATQAAPATQTTTTTVVDAIAEPVEQVEPEAPVVAQPEIVAQVEAEAEVIEQVEPEAIIEAAPAPSIEEETVVEEVEHDAEHDQHMIDEAAKYEHHTVKELREELRRLDLPVSGSKEDLIERLINAQ
jgi:cytoskeletal protein CcmA (bactofilin family)